MSLPTLLVPGLLCSPRLFSPQMPTLWRHGPVMVAGRTRDQTVEEIARRLLADAPPRFVLGGLSMGGYVAMEILRQAPERVAKLVLMATSARPDLPEQSERRRELATRAQSGQMAEVVDELFPRLFHRDRLDNEMFKMLLSQMALETGSGAFVRQQRAIMSRPDSRPGLPAIACPTLVMVGEGDELLPVEHSREIADAIPGAQLAVIPGAGHLLTLETPDRVNAVLDAWLSESG